LVRVKLDPAQRNPIQALASLADGRVLVLAGDGRMYVADLFRRLGKLEPLSADASEANMLLAHTADGRIVLEARLGLASGGGCFLQRRCSYATRQAVAPSLLAVLRRRQAVRI
jgi:hypothetical protein